MNASEWADAYIGLGGIAGGVVALLFIWWVTRK